MLFVITRLGILELVNAVMSNDRMALCYISTMLESF